MYIGISKNVDEHFLFENLNDIPNSDLYLFERTDRGRILNESVYFIDGNGQRSNFHHGNYALKNISYPHDGQGNNYHFVFTFEYSDAGVVVDDIKISTVTKNQNEFPKALTHAIRRIIETDECDVVSKQLIKKMKEKISNVKNGGPSGRY